MDQEDRDRIAAEARRALVEGQFDRAQYPHSAELVAALIAGDRVADRFQWLGEAAIYDVEGEWPVLYLVAPEQNPMLQRPVEAAVALAEHALLPLTDPDELQALKQHADTVRVLIVELDLKVGGDCCWPTTPRQAREGPKSSRRDAKHPHFHIEVEDGASSLNPAQRRVAEALFGQPIEAYLDWLRGREVYQTKIMTLWQGGVIARHEKHGPFAMGARLSEVRGHWEVDGNVLLSCDGLLGRRWEAGRPSTLPPPW
jgi:hypothetical protein